MKEYFYLNGKVQNGPFTVEQLTNKGLTNETLIWTEGMENWQRLKDIPELVQSLQTKSVPPPPPFDNNDEKIIKTEVSGELKLTTEKLLNPTLEAIIPDKKTLTWLIVWCGFHLFALLMSYSEIEIFNNDGEPRTDKFWPFVEYTYTNFYTGKLGFNGIFNNYDWTEFALYVGGALVIYFFIRISNKQEISNS